MTSKNMSGDPRSSRIFTWLSNASQPWVIVWTLLHLIGGLLVVICSTLTTRRYANDILPTVVLPFFLWILGLYFGRVFLGRTLQSFILIAFVFAECFTSQLLPDFSPVEYVCSLVRIYFRPSWDYNDADWQ